MATTFTDCQLVLANGVGYSVKPGSKYVSAVCTWPDGKDDEVNFCMIVVSQSDGTDIYIYTSNFTIISAGAGV